MDEESSSILSSRAWRIGMALFAFINVGGAAYALWMGEPAHAGVHAVLLGAAWVFWERAPWGRRREAAVAQLPDERLQYLQQSVDAIALEVERIGETQRFHEKLMAEKRQSPPPPNNDQVTR